MAIVYLDGEYLPLEKATVSVEDRGFLFGDGIYEVVRYYGGRPFQLDAHMARLEHSATGARLPLPRAVADLAGIIQRLLVENNAQDTCFYIQVTRGAARPRTHAFPAQPQPLLLVMPQVLPALPPDARTQGIRTLTLPDVRWGRCDIKSIMLLPNVMAKTQAREAGAFEAIMIRDGRVTEGSSTNIFAVRDGALRTHPSGTAILGGITRQMVLRLASDLKLKVLESAFTREEMYAADELFLTSTTAEVLPIARVDERSIGTGEPGQLTLRLYEAFRQAVRTA